MSRPKYSLISLISLLFISLTFIAQSPAQSPIKVCFPGVCVDVEVARSIEERNKGLMFRRELGPDQGMLFIFGRPDRYAFWMKNMNFPIDVIWMDKDKKVIGIKENFPPCRDDHCPAYRSGADAQYILEMSSGFVSRHQIKVGQQVVF